MRRINSFLLVLAAGAVLLACNSKPDAAPQETLFRSLSPEETGVDFRNDLGFDPRFNIFTYRNYYNGGGVALGDVNGDGLLDIYVTANQGPNKLYLNRGDFRFEDVTDAAGVAGNAAWATGVAMADVNGDGLLDIYVCNSGDVAGDNKKNELFINNGDGTFTEQAEAYGLADEGFSTHAVFFDFDGDGDLDVYLLNNSYQAIGSFNKMQNERVRRDPVGGDKLYRNDGGRFVDVSEEAGIFGSVIGFGLGITIGDVNRDGLPDIFISNDFFEKDYLYINQGDGTFSEELEQYMRSISAASMGADIADINNDGFPDIFVTDMLPEPQTRLKQVTTFENWDKFQFNKTHDYHYQFNRNMLHLNNGDGTFSEIGRMTGMEATDWSWAALIADFDSDGLKDVFVANGIYQDITDLDYLNFIDNEETKRQIISKEAVDYKALIDPIPVNPISNYAFQNKGDLFFENVAASWGLDTPNHANGAAYGDLNNDGYLDLVVNQVNGALAIYKNQSAQLQPEHHFLQVQLKGKGMNTSAIGAQVQVLTASGQKYLEQMPNRGFQSSVDPKLTIGLGADSLVQRLTVRWPDGTFTVKEQVKTNQLLTLDQEEAVSAVPEGFYPKVHAPAFTLAERPAFQHTHEENKLVDFDRERLLYHKRSTEGPAFAETTVADGTLIYIGGAKGFAGRFTCWIPKE
ncbi:hypothetical protein A3SI_00771 [Nitritalea halalkaliphila LW7]|uniref:ASPIC/UnbV domain-containing protein n=1 Tax=Nitritalea halalkaliphila LW7 TaxID=1189621 RepID=I5C9V2_9BACT|nr:CRTAC1 family protein [Nitritalea halalkaliphila]EIM78604.1 hypothetical protein A3SI_00771 [Nitritalea halalkaliphila LW7]